MRYFAACLLPCMFGPVAFASSPFVITQVDAGLFRSRAPRLPSEFEKIRQAGVRTILDMRAYQPLESLREAHFAARHGMAYRHILFSGLPHGVNTCEEVFQATLCEKDYPLLVHCQHNRDRTSLVVGLYRVRVQGWAPQDAYDEMLRFHLREILQHMHRYFWNNAYGIGKPAERGGASGCHPGSGR